MMCVPFSLYWRKKLGRNANYYCGVIGSKVGPIAVLAPIGRDDDS
jgi:hypothetical protein